jgi:hypothetical protein
MTLSSVWCTSSTLPLLLKVTLLRSLEGEKEPNTDIVDMKDSVDEFEPRWLRWRRRSWSSICDSMVKRRALDADVCAKTSSPVKGEPSVNREVRGGDVGLEVAMERGVVGVVALGVVAE